MIGYETAHYVFVPDTPPAPVLKVSDTSANAAAPDSNSGRIRLALSRATEVINGNPAIETRTLRNDLHFSSSPGYFRLLFMLTTTPLLSA